MPNPDFTPRPGQIDFTDAKRAPVINCIVQYGAKILIVRRSEKLNFYPGVWNGISGFLDEPDKTIADKVHEELREELGIFEHDIISMEEGGAIEQEDPQYGKTWIVHPVLVKVGTNVIHLDREAEKYVWVDSAEVWNYDLLPGFGEVIKTFFPTS